MTRGEELVEEFGFRLLAADGKNENVRIDEVSSPSDFA
jgi:hypothetical protein